MDQIQEFKFPITNIWCNKLITPVNFILLSLFIPFAFLGLGFTFVACFQSIIIFVVYIILFFILLIFSLNYYKRLFVKKYMAQYYSEAVAHVSQNEISIDVLNHNAAHCASYRFSIDDITSIGYAKRLSHSWSSGGYFGQGLIIRTRDLGNIVLKLELPFQYLGKAFDTKEYVAFCRSILHAIKNQNKACGEEKIKIGNPIVWNPLLRTLVHTISIIATLLLALAFMFTGALIPGIE
jgi:hypothetical protein